MKILFMKNESYMHENDISMDENEEVRPWHGFPAPEVFMGSWAVHNFMHGIFIHEILWAFFVIFMHEILMPQFFHARNFSSMYNAVCAVNCNGYTM